MVSQRMLKRVTVAATVLFVLLQAIPYGHQRINPPVVTEPAWDSAATRELVKRACFDCHSNETRWPWYAKIAPSSWLVHYDVVTARGKLNFSDWQDGMLPGESSKVITRLVLEKKMPPSRYLVAHPEARLTDRERARLVEGIQRTLGGS